MHSRKPVHDTVKRFQQAAAVGLGLTLLSVGGCSVDSSIVEPSPEAQNAPGSNPAEAVAARARGPSPGELSPSLRTISPLAPSPVLAAKLAKNARGRVALAGLPGGAAPSLPGWSGRLTLRERIDGGADVELSFGATDAGGTSSVNLSLHQQAASPKDLDALSGEHTLAIARARGQRQQAGARDSASLWASGSGYRATAGTVSHLKYEGGRATGTFALTMTPDGAPGSSYEVQGEFDGEIDLRCFVLAGRDNDPPAKGRVKTADGSPYLRLAELSHPFCREYL